MKKIKKIIFISLILLLFIISCIAYSFPNLLDYCFPFSIPIGSFLAISLTWIYPFSRDKQHISIPRFLIASVITIVILVVYVGIFGYFLWHHPLSSITEPIHCFIAIWCVSIFTFSMLLSVDFIFSKVFKKDERKVI